MTLLMHWLRKQLLLWNALFLLVPIVTAQPTQVKTIDRLQRQALSGKRMLLRYERIDTIDATGKELKLYRSYYLSKAHPALSLVSIKENEADPHKGLQVLFLYENHSLVKVVVTPSRFRCKGCEAAYYFGDNVLVYKKEIAYSVPHIESLIEESYLLKDRVPGKLLWGYFEWEHP